MTANQLTNWQSGVRIKSIALPAEHGGWGLLLEPIVLGLLLTPSFSGFYLALSAVGFFLARHPLTLVVLNGRRKSPRTSLAKQFAAVYLMIGIAAFAAAIVFAQHSFALPVVMAAPFAMVQIAHDWSGRRRALLSEIAGGIAISSLAPSIALSHGWSPAESFALWGIMMARSLPAILYVRARVARLHRRAVSGLPMLAAHLCAVVVAAGLWRTGLGPRLAVVVMIILLARAVFGFVRFQRATAKQVGFSEIAFGAMTVLALVLGRAWAW